MEQALGLKKKKVPFSQRLFWSVFSIFLGFTVCFLIFQYQRERIATQEKLNSVLSNYNYQLHYRYQYTKDLPLLVKQFIEEIPQKDLRVTIIDNGGNVLFDNSGRDEFSNHNDRSEVRLARIDEEGFAIRSSASTGIRYFYSASKFDKYVFRSALPYDLYSKNILSVNKDFIYFMAFMVLFFFFVLLRFTFSIGKTISKLRDFSQNVEEGRMPETGYEFPDDELGEISEHMINLYHRQQKNKDELALQRAKLIKHFQYAREGFAMFTAEGEEILSNNLFIQFGNLISDTHLHYADELINIYELTPISDFLNKNIHDKNPRKKVFRESLTIDKKGNAFQIECLLFLDNSYEISINDISRQEEESRMKRQLTQNVAHELKTPVSSIQGYLETILSNPDLPSEKREFFIERCYTQSTRLTDLLRDISVLNRLDEATEMFELAHIHISRLLNEIENECSKEMEEKSIRSEIILPGDPVVYGNYSLLYSIFRNLYDNTISYAGEGTRIVVNCYKEDSKYYYFSFSDNGVGIDEEHINRIFERFYRVDKGRSRKMGGTGLGLSIVKNGVHFHKGQISAKSSPCNGITFFFTLKKKL